MLDRSNVLGIFLNKQHHIKLRFSNYAMKVATFKERGEKKKHGLIQTGIVIAIPILVIIELLLMSKALG